MLVLARIDHRVHRAVDRCAIALRARVVVTRRALRDALARRVLVGRGLDREDACRRWQLWIDRDAAGYGWQLNSLNGIYPSVNDGMDLLLVVAHELGHKLGFEHSYEVNDLMAPRLDVSSVRTMVGSLSQPLASFSTSLVVLGSVPMDGTNPSVLGTLLLPKEEFEENQARDQLFASLDESPAKPLVRSPNIARKFQSDATKKPASEAEDLLAEDLMDTIALAQLATEI